MCLKALLNGWVLVDLGSLLVDPDLGSLPVPANAENIQYTSYPVHQVVVRLNGHKVVIHLYPDTWVIQKQMHEMKGQDRGSPATSWTLITHTHHGCPFQQAQLKKLFRDSLGMSISFKMASLSQKVGSTLKPSNAPPRTI